MYHYFCIWPTSEILWILMKSFSLISSLTFAALTIAAHLVCDCDIVKPCWQVFIRLFQLLSSFICDTTLECGHTAWSVCTQIIQCFRATVVPKKCPSWERIKLTCSLNSNNLEYFVVFLSPISHFFRFALLFKYYVEFESKWMRHCACDTLTKQIIFILLAVVYPMSTAVVIVDYN